MLQLRYIFSFSQSFFSGFYCCLQSFQTQRDVPPVVIALGFINHFLQVPLAFLTLIFPVLYFGIDVAPQLFGSLVGNLSCTLYQSLQGAIFVAVSSQALFQIGYPLLGHASVRCQFTGFFQCCRGRLDFAVFHAQRTGSGMNAFCLGYCCRQITILPSLVALLRLFNLTVQGNGQIVVIIFRHRILCIQICGFFCINRQNQRQFVEDILCMVHSLRQILTVFAFYYLRQ